MRKFVALLCSLVLLFGIALCEEAPVDTPDIEIIEEVTGVSGRGVLASVDRSCRR